MRPPDIALLSAAGEVTVAPDAAAAVYTLKTVDLAANRYRTRLWLAPLDGGRPRPLTGGDDDGLPRWSPDGALLAWVAETAGGGAEIRVLGMDGPGEAAVVCSWPDDITELAWSPTSDRLAFVGRVRDPDRYGAPGTSTAPADMPPRRITRLLGRHNGDGWVVDRPLHVHVVPVDGSAPPLALTTGDAPAGDVAWAPDATRVVYASGTHDTWDLDERRDLWVADATGGTPPVRVTDTTLQWSLPSWSPDGTRIAAYARPALDEPSHGRLLVVDPDTGTTARWAGGLDCDVAPYGATRAPVWADGELLVAVADRGAVHVRAAVDPAGGEGRTRLVVGGARTVGSFAVAAGVVAFVASAHGEPGELHVGHLADAGAPAAVGADPVTVEPGPTRKLSDHGATLRDRVDLVAPERFVASGVDGAGIECWAMAPVGAAAGTRHPAVLNIHGGPFTQYGYGFFDEFQLQVGAGIGVVYCNPRGSSGYSEAWGRAIRWPEATVDPGSGWGGVDHDDVMACVDAALDRFDWIDPDRLGVQGGSYGGYLTSWTVGHTDRFRAAVSERAVNNLVTMEHNSDISGFFRSYAGWSHLERPDIYARQSPATYVDALTTPMLLVHSEDDLRCPISQAEELFVALRLLGRDPELVRFPGEDHELSRSGRPRHRVARAEIILEWFARHLALGAATTEAR
jgi:dipeptidyl aminopeptidase/acylaminoacyl peptidase